MDYERLIFRLNGAYVRIRDLRLCVFSQDRASWIITSGPLSDSEHMGRRALLAGALLRRLHKP